MKKSNPKKLVLRSCLILSCFLLFALTTLPQDSESPIKKLQKKVETVAEKAIPAFVFVLAEKSGAGSGIIISEEGHFFTNHHVAGAFKKTSVSLHNGKKYEAKRICTDIFGDIALFKIDSEEKFPYVEFGDSDNLEIGEYVVAVGDPFMLSMASPDKDKNPTVTLGIISALHRNQSMGYSDVIQTDAAINPGNSGGPLFTLEGKLIGINGRIATRFFNRTNSGVGFAIPINQIKRFLDTMKKGGENGKVYHGKIEGLKLSHLFSNGEGVTISQVKSDSTADKAGFKKGDIITQLETYTIFSETRFLGALDSYPAGAKITIKVKRGDEVKDIEVTLDKNILKSDKPPRPNAGWLGVKYKDAPGNKGAMITSVVPDSPADTAGIQVGDTVTKFDDKEIKTTKKKRASEQLTELIKSKDAGDNVTITIKRGEQEIELQVTLAKYPSEEE